MDVYHCLVLTRPDGVPQLRDLWCETEADIEAAVRQAVSEWSEVVRVDVFRNGEAVAAFSARRLREMAAPIPPETPPKPSSSE